MSKEQTALVGEDGTDLEVKRGRGRPRKDGTIGENNKEKPASTKKNGYTIEEVQAKLDILIGAIARVTGAAYEYNESDYRQEAAALVRLATKFEIVSQAIALFDPILLVLGLAAKITSVFRRPKAENLDGKSETAPFLRSVRNG